MDGINRATLLGNLGRDPELKYTTSGKAVCTLRIATTETYKDDGDRKQNTEWHNVVCWDKKAEFAGERLKKGDVVYIEGKIKTRSWTDKETNKKAYTTEIVCDVLTVLTPKNQSNNTNFEDDSEKTEKTTEVTTTEEKTSPKKAESKPVVDDPFADFDTDVEL